MGGWISTNSKGYSFRSLRTNKQGSVVGYCVRLAVGALMQPFALRTLRLMQKSAKSGGVWDLKLTCRQLPLSQGSK